jgi:hypothetical protein
MSSYLFGWQAAASVTRLGPIENRKSFLGSTRPKSNHFGGVFTRPSPFGQICPIGNVIAPFKRCPLSFVGKFSLNFLESLVFSQPLNFSFLALAICLD